MGFFQKAYEEDLRLIAKDLDPNYNFKEQTHRMRVTFFNCLGASKRIVLLLEGFTVFYLRGCLLGCLQCCPVGYIYIKMFIGMFQKMSIKMFAGISHNIN